VAGGKGVDAVTTKVPPPKTVCAACGEKDGTHADTCTDLVGVKVRLERELAEVKERNEKGAIQLEEVFRERAILENRLFQTHERMKELEIEKNKAVLDKYTALSELTDAEARAKELKEEAVLEVEKVIRELPFSGYEDRPEDWLKKAAQRIRDLP
jgi:hypothetical protein